MSQPLPISDYKYLSRGRIKRIDWTKQSADQETGYLVCVDLDYPTRKRLLVVKAKASNLLLFYFNLYFLDLHKDHENFPLAPNIEDIDYNMLSPYSKGSLYDITDKPRNYKAKKLVGSFLPKRGYRCHYLSLKYYLSKGLILKKVHNVLSFRQEAHIKPYIDLTTRLRKESKTVFKKNIWKKFNNALYVRKNA